MHTPDVMPSNFLTKDESLEHEQELPNVRFMCGTLGVELPVCVCPFQFRASLSSPYSHFLPNSLNPPSLTPTLHTSYTYYPVTHSFTHSNTNSFLSPPPPPIYYERNMFYGITAIHVDLYVLYASYPGTTMSTHRREASRHNSDAIITLGFNVKTDLTEHQERHFDLEMCKQ